MKAGEQLPVVAEDGEAGRAEEAPQQDHGDRQRPSEDEVHPQDRERRPGAREGDRKDLPGAGIAPQLQVKPEGGVESEVDTEEEGQHAPQGSLIEGRRAAIEAHQQGQVKRQDHHERIEQQQGDMAGSPGGSSPHR